jgi:hypothetical protein
LGLESGGRLCGNTEIESASIEVRSKSWGWLEKIVNGKLGKNNVGRLANAKMRKRAID